MVNYSLRSFHARKFSQSVLFLLLLFEISISFNSVGKNWGTVLLSRVKQNTPMIISYHVRNVPKLNFGHRTCARLKFLELGFLFIHGL